MFNKQLLQYLIDTKAELEKEGAVATLEEAINRLQESMVEDDGESVKPRTEREWAEMDKGDDEYHANSEN